MNFTAWEARRHIESAYKTAMRKLGRFLIGLIDDDDSLEVITNKLGLFSDSEQFDIWAQSLAHTFVTNTLEENARTWRQAARMSGQGNDIRQELSREMNGPVGARYRELIDNNAKYIKSVPKEVASRLVKHVSGQETKGSRSAYKTDEFREYVGDMVNWHARLISRTESAKTMSDLTQARAEHLGHDWAIWHTAEDRRVRDSHKKMDGVMFRFSDKPAPEALIGEKNVGHYGPGEIYNCRCYAEPIIAWDEAEWPMKVYANGSVTTMSKKAFYDKFGGGQ